MSMPLRLHMQGIKKSFSGVHVLKNVDLELHQGRVLALLGENGAGKSTLMKILNGDYSKDHGTLFIDERDVSINAPADAAASGISVIYQELNYLPDINVMENIFLGHLPRKKKWFVDWEEAYQKASSILERLGTDIKPDQPLGQLSIGDKQLVEIAKALSKEAKILVMDEPTAALTSKEVKNLFRVIRDLKEKGVSIIYITHHLDEVMEICDDVMIMRDGERVGNGALNRFTKEQIVQLMIGREVKQIQRVNEQPNSDEVVLHVEGLSKKNQFQDVSFEVKKREIVGIFGLLGSGKESLSKTLFGEETGQEGQIMINGTPVKLSSVADAKKAGIAYVPPDRKVSGLILDMSVKDNLTLASMRKMCSYGFINQEKEINTTNSWVERLNIKLSGGIHRPIRFLSGGNQQKVILARWLLEPAHLLILCEPTMGVDVGAREDIYAKLKELRNEGLSILVVSSDMTELELLADRVLILKAGKLTKEFQHSEITSQNLLAAAMGV